MPERPGRRGPPRTAGRATPAAAQERQEGAARTPEVVVAGLVCLDLVCRVPRPSLVLRPGDLVQLTDSRVSTGGVVGNAGLALERLGHHTRLIGAVGDDPFAGVLRRALAERGAVDVSGLNAIPGAATSYTVVLTPPDGERMFLHEAGTNARFDAAALDLQLVSGARLVHLGYPPLLPGLLADGGVALASQLRAVREREVTVSIDTAMPDPASEAARVDWSAFLHRVLPHTDLFMPSLDELIVLLPELWRAAGTGAGAAAEAPASRADEAERVAWLAGALLAMGARVVLLKMGSEGVYLRTGSVGALETMGSGRPADPLAWADRELWAPSLEADVVGTVGAGDATCAGFLAGLLRGLAVEDALAMATAVGGFSVEAADAVGGIPDWQACRRRLDAGWTPNGLTITARGWRRAGRYALWRGPRDAAGPSGGGKAQGGESGSSA